MLVVVSCGGNDTNWGGGSTEVEVLVGGATDTVTVSGGEELVTVTAGGGGGAGGGPSSFGISGAEATGSGGGVVGWGATLLEGVGEVEALVLSPSPVNPCTMLLKPLTPSQMIPSRFSQRFGTRPAILPPWSIVGCVCVEGCIN